MCSTYTLNECKYQTQNLPNSIKLKTLKTAKVKKENENKAGEMWGS